MHGIPLDFTGFRGIGSLPGSLAGWLNALESCFPSNASWVAFPPNVHHVAFRGIVRMEQSELVPKGVVIAIPRFPEIRVPPYSISGIGIPFPGIVFSVVIPKPFQQRNYGSALPEFRFP